MKWLVRPSELDIGMVSVPGDKSISHRGLMLSAIAAGRSEITNLAPGADVTLTASCLRALGADITGDVEKTVVHGGKLVEAPGYLDAGNSGTTMRLLSGILAGQPFVSTLTGDESLRSRPMRRIAEPLEQMGARVITRSGRAPIRIEGGELRGMTFEPEVPSAQVKSCILLAGLHASGWTLVREPVLTRDHTERMLRFAGISMTTKDHTVTVKGGQRPLPLRIAVPGDFSSAAFLLVAGTFAGNVSVRSVGVNPTRTAFLRVLERMGCRLEVTGQTEQGGEPVATISVQPNDLRGTDIGPTQAPEMLDEMPLIALLGTVATGQTRVTGAAELRVKESDRISVVVAD